MTDQEKRQRCRAMLSKVFKERIESAEEERSTMLGTEVEEEISCKSKSEEMYNKTFRTKYLNLKEESNKWLISAVYSGEIGPTQFVSMTIEEMKSEELRELERQIMKRSILDSTIAKQEAETDIFFCTKCKQRKCTYRALQTRSADEPMTTYVHCVVCGNKWKFS